MNIADRIYELYKPFRNRLTELDFKQTLYYIWTLENNLQYHQPLPQDIPRPPKFLEHQNAKYRRITGVSEWELEFILSEAIINSSSPNSKSILEYKHLKRVVNDLRILTDKTDSLTINVNDVGLHEIFRMAHRQFDWQTGIDLNHAYRYFRIHSHPELSPIFEKHFNLSPFKYYALAYSLAGVFKNKLFHRTQINCEIPGITQEEANRFLQYYTCDIKTLREKIKADKKYDERLFYCHNPLRNTPIIEFEQQLCCPLKTLLLWQSTKGVFYSLINEDGYGNAIGKAFEEYTGYIINQADNTNAFSKSPEIIYDNGSKKSSDWLLKDETAILFIECKAKRISLAGKMEANLYDGLIEDLKRIADDIVKIYKTYVDYKNGMYPGFPFEQNKRVYFQLLSLEEWHFVLPPTLEKLKNIVAEKLVAKNLSVELLNEAPFFITSIDKFETDFQLTQQMGIANYYSHVTSNTIMEEVEKYKFRDLIRKDLNNDFLSKLGAKV